LLKEELDQIGTVKYEPTNPFYAKWLANNTKTAKCQRPTAFGHIFDGKTNNYDKYLISDDQEDNLEECPEGHAWDNTEFIDSATKRVNYNLKNRF